jgi:hypothetical protein
MSKTRIVASLLVVALIFTVVIWGYNIIKKPNEKNPNTSPATLMASTNEQKIAYLKSFGWEVDPTPCEIIEIIIPKEFNKLYTDYNALQKKQGFNLEDLKGKRAKRFTYEVKNYPNSKKDVRANIIEYKSKIVGGDICSYADDGFMHGFELK